MNNEIDYEEYLKSLSRKQLEEIKGTVDREKHPDRYRAVTLALENDANPYQQITLDIENSPIQDSTASKWTILDELGIAKLLKRLAIAGFSLLLVLSLQRELFHGSLSILGHNVIPIGDCQVIIAPVDGINFSSDKSVLGDYNSIDWHFIMYSESLSTNSPVLRGDFLRVTINDNFDEMFNLMASDSSAAIVSHSLSNKYLSVKQRIILNDREVFVLTRFIMAFPYCLRLQAIWFDKEQTPQKVKDSIDAIEVKK